MDLKINKVFIPQNIIDNWLNENRIEIKDDRLIFSDKKFVYKIEPAYYFIKETSGNTDRYKLIGKVKSKREIEKMKGEIFLDSVTIGDNCYEVIEGYLSIAIVEKIEDEEEKKLLDLLLKSIK